MVTLSDSEGHPVAADSINHVEAVKLGFRGHGLRLTVQGVRYNLDAASKMRSHPLADFVPSLALSKTRTLTDTVIEYVSHGHAG